MSFVAAETPGSSEPQVVAAAHDRFVAFVEAVEPRLRIALVARLGPDRGRDAACEALAWAFEHQDRLSSIANPIAYLFRVGVSRTRLRKQGFPRVGRSDMPEVESALMDALRELTKPQQTSIVLIRAYDWTYSEVGELLGISVSSVSTHVRRAEEKLRQTLGEVHL